MSICELFKDGRRVRGISRIQIKILKKEAITTPVYIGIQCDVWVKETPYFIYIGASLLMSLAFVINGFHAGKHMLESDQQDYQDNMGRVFENIFKRVT